MADDKEVDKTMQLMGKIFETIADYRYLDDHEIVVALNIVKTVVENKWKMRTGNVTITDSPQPT